MKFTFAALIVLALSMPAFAKVLFAGRCVPALTKGEASWRVEESRRGVSVRYADSRKRHSSTVRGAEADALRERISALRLSKADIQTLRFREVRTGEDGVLLRPFDGVTYHFTIPPSVELTIDNPSFDLQHHGELEETVRLREVLDLLEYLTHIATKEKQANQPPQRNAGSRPFSGGSPVSETPSSFGPRG